MRTFMGLAVMVVVLFAGSQALAVPPGQSLTFDGSSVGPVPFDGSLHNKAATGCQQCHNDDAFPKMKKGTVKITMKKIYAGKQCGICHNGEDAFAAQANCQRCHQK